MCIKYNSNNHFSRRILFIRLAALASQQNNISVDWGRIIHFSRGHSFVHEVLMASAASHMKGYYSFMCIKYNSNNHFSRGILFIRLAALASQQNNISVDWGSNNHFSRSWPSK